jgi:hypothetical protein
MEGHKYFHPDRSEGLRGCMSSLVLRAAKEA